MADEAGRDHRHQMAESPPVAQDDRATLKGDTSDSIQTVFCVCQHLSQIFSALGISSDFQPSTMKTMQCGPESQALACLSGDGTFASCCEELELRGAFGLPRWLSVHSCALPPWHVAY